MPSKSGILTSYLGYLTLDATPNDTLSITPTAATYSIEYPVGTLLVSNSTASTTYTLGAGQCRLICNSGYLAYSLLDNPDTTDSTSAGSSLSVVQAAAVTGGLSGKTLALTLDGSNRPVTLTKGANVFTVARPSSTSLTITLPNTGGLPSSVVTATTTATGEVLTVSGNFP